MSLEPLLVAKDGTTLAGYLHPLPDYYRYIFPAFQERFDQINKLIYKGRKLSEYRYLTAGQVALREEY